jgi:hypothetical protein
VFAFVRKLEREIASSYKGNVRPMTEGEVKEYMQQLREKSQEYNALRVSNFCRIQQFWVKFSRFLVEISVMTERWRIMYCRSSEGPK